MKKILSVFIIFLIFSSCTKLEDLNKNIKDPTEVPGEYLFTGAQKNIFDMMVNANVNRNIFRLFAQYWTETTYLDEVNYDLVTRSIPDNFWNLVYRNCLKNLDEAKKIITATKYGADPTPAKKNNKLAVVEVLTIYSWMVLVETFGNVPYSEALDVDKPSPKYDDGLTIYKDLITRLNAAITTMNVDPASGSFDFGDNMYSGDVTLWLKFANSLKLHMGMVLADKDATYAKTIVEAAAPNAFDSNTDNAVLPYQASQPNTNQIYVDLVASGRKDFVAANTIIDYMNSVSDPRLGSYFTLVDTSGSGTWIYYGAEYGFSAAYAQFSHVADPILQPDFEGMIFDLSEVEFLKAEAVERGWNVGGGTAEDHYKAAITASMEYWGVSSTDIATYLARPDVAYPTATGTWKQKIGTQQWIAYYNRGFEAWTEWRRMDYPVLVAPSTAETDIPVRFTFPVAEQTLNKANFDAAVSALGTKGDAVDNKIFWDVY